MIDSFHVCLSVVADGISWSILRKRLRQGHTLPNDCLLVTYLKSASLTWIHHGIRLYRVLSKYSAAPNWSFHSPSGPHESLLADLWALDPV